MLEINKTRTKYSCREHIWAVNVALLVVTTGCIQVLQNPFAKKSIQFYRISHHSYWCTQYLPRKLDAFYYKSITLQTKENALADIFLCVFKNKISNWPQMYKTTFSRFQIKPAEKIFVKFTLRKQFFWYTAKEQISLN